MIGKRSFLCVCLALVVAMPSFARAKTASSSNVTSTPVVAHIHNAVEVEKRVREAFVHTPVMAEVARCESKFRQYTDGGNVLRGGAGAMMLGVFQFFESIHRAPARALGFDIYTLEGNIGYAKYVYEKSGTTPWKSSSACWGKSLLSAQITVPALTQVQLQAKILELTKLVLALQKQLLALQAGEKKK